MKVITRVNLEDDFNQRDLQGLHIQDIYEQVRGSASCSRTQSTFCTFIPALFYAAP